MLIITLTGKDGLRAFCGVQRLEFDENILEKIIEEYSLELYKKEVK